MLHTPNLLCAKPGRVCVCVFVGYGPSKMLFPNCKKTKCRISRIFFVPSKGERVCVCVGNGPFKMLFSQLQKKQKASSAESPSCHQSRERENTGLVLRFLLAGRQAPPPRNAVVWWVRLTAPAPHEETSPPKRESLCDRREGDSVWEMVHPKCFFPAAKKAKCFINQISFVPSTGECVCVCVSEMVHPECFFQCFYTMVHRPPKCLDMFHRMFEHGP